MDSGILHFFLDLFDKDLLRVVEESRINGNVLATFNATFITVIPKTDKVICYDDFRPISLCNCIYKIIAMTIARRIRGILSSSISQEQFEFLVGRHIHDAIGVAQEVIHPTKIKTFTVVVINVDLSNAYGKVNW